MIKDVRCPKCNKLIAKREEKAEGTGIYFFCPKCKINFKIERNCTLVVDKL